MDAINQFVEYVHHDGVNDRYIIVYGGSFIVAPGLDVTYIDVGGERHYYFYKSTGGSVSHVFLSQEQYPIVQPHLRAPFNHESLSPPDVPAVLEQLSVPMTSTFPAVDIMTSPTATERLMLISCASQVNMAALNEESKMRLYVHLYSWVMENCYEDPAGLYATFPRGVTVRTAPWQIVLASLGIPQVGFNKHTMIQLHLMVVLCLKKSFKQPAHFTEYCKKRTEAALNQMNQPSTIPAVLSASFSDLGQIWEMEPRFATYLARVLRGAPPAAAFPHVLHDQYKLICGYAGMSAFKMALDSYSGLMNTPLGTNPSFISELLGGFLVAKQFHDNIPIERRPYIMLEKPAGFECLQHKQYPIMAYAGAKSQAMGRTTMNNFVFDEKLSPMMKIVVDRTLDWIRENADKIYQVDETTIAQIRTFYPAYAPYKEKITTNPAKDLVDLIKIINTPNM